MIGIWQSRVTGILLQEIFPKVVDPQHSSAYLLLAQDQQLANTAELHLHASRLKLY
jgi:hypothetical protein